MSVLTVDTKGLNCPLPVLRAKKAISDLNPGDTLEVLTTDPAAVNDFEAFSRATGHELSEWSEDSGVIRILLKKCA